MSAIRWLWILPTALAWGQSPIETQFQLAAYDSLIRYCEGRRPTEFDARDLWCLARSYYYLGQNTRSIDTYDHLLNREVSDSLRNWIHLGYAEVLIETARYDECQSFLLHPRQLFTDSMAWKAHALNVRGVYYLRTAQYDDAERCLVAAWHQASQGRLLRELSIIATHLGIVKRLTGDLDGALYWYGESRPWIEQNKRTADGAVLHTNLGIVFYELGNHAMASRHFDSALVQYRSVYDYAGISLVLGNKSAMLIDAGKFDEAMEILGQAIQYAEEANDLYGLCQWRLNRAIVELRLNRVAAAAKAFGELTGEFEKLHRPVEAAGSLLGLAECLDRLGNADSAIALCKTASGQLSGMPETSDLWLSFFLLGRFYLAKEDTQQALAQWNAALHTIEQMRDDLDDAALADYFFEYDRQQVYRELSWLLLDCGRTKDAFEIFERGRARGIKSYANVGEPKGTSLCFIVGSTRLGVFIVKDSSIDFVLLGNPHEIKGRVADFLSQIRSSDISNEALQRSLYDALLKPVQPFLDRNEAVRIVPDEFLFYLPFETLHADMLNRLVSYSFSGHSLASADFSGVPADFWIEATDQFDSLASLPGVRKETALLRGMATQLGLTVRTGFGSWVKGEILHIATHATHNPADPSMSGFYSRGSNGLPRRITALEVQQSGAKARLVVLSACETGLGELLSGEGLVGLPRAFIINGSEHVIATLWRVNDEATSQFMADFYSQLCNGVPPGEALRLTKLGMQGGPWGSPRFWAGFLLWTR